MSLGYISYSLKISKEEIINRSSSSSAERRVTVPQIAQLNLSFTHLEIKKRCVRFFADFEDKNDDEE